MGLLEVAGISLQEEENLVLNNISFTQQAGQKFAIAGETGSGKSTLLQIIAGLVQADAGLVRFDGKRVKGPAEELVPGHPEIAYLTQQFELPQFLRVEQVLRYANKLGTEEARTLYGLCRIDHLLKRKTDQLSGGERQRIALTRLLLSRPRLLLLDEPYSNLDTGHKQMLKEVIREISQELDLTTILISHDPQDTLSWADKILVLQGGLLLQSGTPGQIYRQPVNEYVAGLFGDYNLPGAAAAQAISSLPGIRVQQGKKMMIRPEHLAIAPAGPQGLPGSVVQVTFFGSYEEIAVSLTGDILKIKTAACQFKPGDRVYLSLEPDALWYL